MAYYIKTIGVRVKPISIFTGRFPRMLLYQMCFQTENGKVQNIRKGDKFVIYCIRDGVKKFPDGGFIGIQDVLGDVRKNTTIFKKPWVYIVDIQPKVYSFRNVISLKEVKKWDINSKKLKLVLRARLHAIGGLLEIDKIAYKKFLEESVKKIRQIEK